MKKTILLLTLSALSILSLNAQKNEKSGKIHNLGSTINVMSVSPNGEYVTGYQMYNSYAILWTEDNGSVMIAPEGGCSANAVSNNGTIVGQFYDPEITYEDWEGNIQNLFSAGYCYNGQWTGLGVKPELLQQIDPTMGSMAEAISADGTIIGGSMYYPSWILEPTVWTNSNPQALEIEMIGQGGRVQGMSADGVVVAGWIAPYYSRLPAVWINGALTIITNNGIVEGGEAFGVSPNGKYVGLIIGGLAAVYDVQEDNLIIIGKKESARSAYATSVSDNGIAIGYNQITMGLDREGFIYTEKMGMINLNEYLVAAGVTGAESAQLQCPMDISADGTRIVGFSSNVDGWVVDVEHNISGYYPPRNLTATEDTYRQINLTWTAAKSDPGNILTGYNIYRNGTKINSSVILSTSYTDNVTDNGSYIYSVKAVWNQTNESLSTNEVTINSGIITVPFLDEFNSLDFATNFWTISSQSEFNWALSEYDGISAPCINYFSPSGTYNQTLSSAFIDATETTQLFLSFNIYLSQAQYNNANDKLKIEIYDGTQWQFVDEFSPLLGESGSFTYHNYNITEFAAGKITRVKITGYGHNSMGESLLWSLDNINVYSPEDALVIEVPLRVTAHKSQDGTVHVNWADPGKLATLSYLENDYLYDGIGNEGVPFIAANKFEADDLKGYDYYYLNSISALLTDAVYSPSQLKLAVFLGTERVVDQEIDSYELNAWNTFDLAEPIFITKDIDKDLYFGIEVVSHSEGEIPLGVCVRPLLVWSEDEVIYAYEGRSNLYSEDGGQTWGTLTEFELFYSHGIKANLIGSNEPVAKERLMGYKVYRDGESLLGQDWIGNDYLTALHNYTDTTSFVSDDACYQVSAYYNVQQESEKAQFCLGDEIEGITTIDTENQYTIYPNPTTGIINIEGEFDNVTVYGLDGRKLITTSEKLINLNKFPKGMYLIKINSKNNNSITQKVIKY
ncbi:MAG: T9SS type A sorting domain-containing protein [Bacteroidales bacterium]|jgi:hypothetical protein|nr:T9SS type A sorting domain-containing protein [Bacteroidales bacterium]